MAQAYYATRLSPRLSLTPEGFLICKDAVLCRTGEQEYRGSEVGIATDNIVVVSRPESEVFDPRFLASLEGKPIIDSHGSGFIDSDSASWKLRGHVQNVRRGPTLKSGDASIIGDLFIMDRTLIEKILNKQARELSVGYELRYLRNADGSLTQTNLRANHVAVVPLARGGSEVRIYDAATADEDEITMEEEEVNNRDEIEEISGIDDESAARALDCLRKMRPMIERSGDRKAIDAYNSAVRALKRRDLLSADERTPAQRIADAQFWTLMQNEVDPDRSFEDTVKRARARMLGQRAQDEPRNDPERSRRAADESLMSDESWGESMREAGRRMREKKY